MTEVAVHARVARQPARDRCLVDGVGAVPETKYVPTVSMVTVIGEAGLISRHRRKDITIRAGQPRERRLSATDSWVVVAGRQGVLIASRHFITPSPDHRAPGFMVNRHGSPRSDCLFRHPQCPRAIPDANPLNSEPRPRSYRSALSPQVPWAHGTYA